MRRAPGIREVAYDAGVSHQTVSRVLNKHPSVRAATRSRVIASIERLDYVVHNGARSMRSRRSRVVGVLISLGPGSVVPALLPVLEAEARRRELWMLVGFLSPGEDPEMGMRRLSEAAVDGLVVVAPVHSTGPANVGESLGVPVAWCHGLALEGLQASAEHALDAVLRPPESPL